MAWRSLIQRNFGWKLVSLLLATVVWLTYQSDAGKRIAWAQNLGLIPPTREFVRHPVNLITLNGDTRRFLIEPKEVEITVEGERTTLLRLSAEDVRAVVDLTKSQISDAETNRVRVLLPPDVRLVEVLPTSVRITPSSP